eukprot:TRINITY_DN7309_c0_g1_i1.p1 TRINITY_DN7309_c0_g1~~TRINITY_DN7309_c0_g1_i1.p1  ORF type:complete len:508 (+),score=68.71 TRINITY_DN7309_c0_g1_i1:241-1764(+)
MEPPPLAKYLTRKSKKHFFSGGSSRQDPEVVDLTPSGSSASTLHNRKRNKVVPSEIIEIDGDEDLPDFEIIGDSSSGKNTKATMGYDRNWLKPQMKLQDALANNLMGSDIDLRLGNGAPMYPLNAFVPEPLGLSYPSKLKSGFMDMNDIYNIGAQFDTMDLPPWVEAPIPWLQNPSCPMPVASSSTVLRQTNSSKLREGSEGEVERKFRSFKQFDTVNDYSDHHYTGSSRVSFLGNSLMKKASLDWSKKIQQEWKILEKDLPESIFVRVYEERMDLLRAVIIGATGTPYHDGLFFFDIFFPSNYPAQPPLVYYYSGGLRLNPNLYACGKVCLSLLNTWTGSKSEQWTPGKSTMLQVLVSIQALVLNAKPYFNEPGYANLAGRPDGEKSSLAYNEDTFLLSCKTMLYTLKKPPKHFEDFVVGHFRKHAHSILVACKAYMDGAQVGCLVGGGVQDVDEGDKSCSSKFKSSLGVLFPMLVTAFTDNGADCRQFLNLAKANNADTSLKLRL